MYTAAPRLEKSNQFHMKWSLSAKFQFSSRSKWFHSSRVSEKTIPQQTLHRDIIDAIIKNRLSLYGFWVPDSSLALALAPSPIPKLDVCIPASANQIKLRSRLVKFYFDKSHSCSYDSYHKSSCKRMLRRIAVLGVVLRSLVNSSALQ